MNLRRLIGFISGGRMLLHQQHLHLFPYRRFPLNDTVSMNIEQFDSFQPISPSFRGKEGYVLDVQCSTGETTKLLSRDYPEMIFLGIDKNQINIDIAKKKYFSLDFMKADFETDIIPQDSFQIIQLSDYQDLAKAVVKSFFSLQSNGLLIVKKKPINGNADFEMLEEELKTNPALQFISTYHIIGNKFYIYK